ncbi:MAG: hypothetical protein ABI614_05455 [Planctomycetota bacterium]
MNRSFFIPLTIVFTLAAGHVEAGMPSALPEDFVQVFRLNENIGHRLQSISFFGLVFVLATIAFWGLWNNLARSFSALPRLNLARAACLTLLLGALFVVVLTMISGARELLTPGAWQKQGVTYTVAPGSRSESDDASSNVTQVLP